MATAATPSPQIPEPYPSPRPWTLEAYLAAWEGGAFPDRVELIQGEVWPAPIGPWHGHTVGNVFERLPDGRYQKTMASLPSAGSLPDPDCWVLPRSAKPIARLSRRMVAWDPADVLLVVEVSDETVEMDLGIKAALYARSGYRFYWVVTREAIYEHGDPTEAGYRTRTAYRPGDRIPVDYAGSDLPVDDLIAPG